MTPIDELVAREAIRDCLFRYCRGIDRADEAALRSAYWPDGTDRHGPYQGSAAGFCDWAMAELANVERGVHQLHNILIDLRDDRHALVESYFSAFQRQTIPRGLVQYDMKGRYLDHFERRRGEWRILHRIVVYDWVEEMPLPSGREDERFAVRAPIGGRFPDDPVYPFLG